MIPRIIPIFISSPHDLKIERKIVKESIQDLSLKMQTLYGIVLTPVNWEEFRPFAEKDNIMDTIISRLEKSALFVGMFGERYGTPNEEGFSPTHEEFNYAIEHKENLKVLTYFKKLKNNPSNDYEIEQRHNLKRVKDDLISAHVTFKEIENRIFFKKYILLDLMEAVLEMTLEKNRRDRLNQFFKFGISTKQREATFLIGYPPIHKHMESSNHEYNWRERLLPNVIYEDFRAIRKIESVLHCAGISDFKAVTTHYSELSEPGNRIWLCVPRNEIAQNKMRLFEKNIYFHFEGEHSTERFIKWSAPRKKLTIYSPLHHYLNLQRPREKKPWSPRLGNIVARDYAILARFRDDAESTGHSQEPFYHYFLAGIRGLGTWGAGWYIDKCYNELAELCKDKDKEFQIILEVEFQRYRIRSVKNVTNKNQEYFDMCNSEEYIKEHISKEGYNKKLSQV